MAYPKIETILHPLLKAAGDGKEYKVPDFVDQLAHSFNLSEQESNEIASNRSSCLFYARLGWANSYLKHAGLIESTRRRYYRITERGKGVLEQRQEYVDLKYLASFPEFIDFIKGKSKKRLTNKYLKTPEGILEKAYEVFQNKLAKNVLHRLIHCSSMFFEHLVVKLLIKMGYGDSQSDVALAFEPQKDGCIDGIINDDRLGFGVIYVQASRWPGIVDCSVIQRFVDALAVKPAKKGIFITTSSFSPEAIKYAAEIDTRIILIDGKRLADYIIEYNIGVTTIRSLQIKKLDMDFYLREPFYKYL
jgi:restriction system protein